MVKKILRLEGLAIFLATSYLYSVVGVGWLFFVVMFLVPDVSMIGYLYGKKAGAQAYNFVHNFVFSFLLVLLGILTNNVMIMATGLIFTAHIGMDRFFGFGLKYESGFKDSHVQRV